MTEARDNAIVGALFLLLPGGLSVWLAFRSGGYFPDSTALAALALGFVLLLRVAVSPAPFAGFGTWVAVAGGGLMLYAAWTLASAAWSDAPARALLEFNRALLYLFAFVLFASFGRTVRRVRQLVWGLAAGLTIVSLAGLVTRLLPDVWTIDAPVQVERLSYPIGYWNALGLTAGLAAVLCLHLATSEREPRWARVVAAGALPAVATTLLFTFSRGALAATVVALLVYLLLARSWGAIPGLLAVAPPTALALATAYGAELLASKQPTTAAAAAQGHEVAVVVAVSCAGAALLRALLLPLDARLARIELASTARRALGGAAALFAAAGVIALWIGSDAGDWVEAQSDRVRRSDVGQTGDFRDRLTDPGINRLDHWEIALDAFRADPLRGQGAATFTLEWERNRQVDSDSEEGHSLYLEALAELGLVGAALLAIPLLALLAGVAVRLASGERALYAAVLAAVLAWLSHAGVDWDWEVPAVTLWLFCLAGGVLAEPAREAGARPRPRDLRRRLPALAACLVLAATPALVAISERHLSRGLSAFHRGDCEAAASEASASVEALELRPEPYEVLGYCDVAAGRSRAGVRMMSAAVERDPGNWKYHYGLALARASAGLDPRREVRSALHLNPREPSARLAARRLSVRDARAWRRAAASLGIPRR